MSKRLELFDTMIAKGSTDPFVHYARAMELRSLGRREDALAAFETVASTFPDYVPTYLMAAQLGEELGDAARARTLGEAGIEAARRASDGKALSELRALVAGLPTD